MRAPCKGGWFAGRGRGIVVLGPDRLGCPGRDLRFAPLPMRSRGGRPRARRGLRWARSCSTANGCRATSGARKGTGWGRSTTTPPASPATTSGAGRGRAERQEHRAPECGPEPTVVPHYRIHDDHREGRAPLPRSSTRSAPAGEMPPSLAAMFAFVQGENARLAKDAGRQPVATRSRKSRHRTAATTGSPRPPPPWNLIPFPTPRPRRRRATPPAIEKAGRDPSGVQDVVERGLAPVRDESRLPELAHHRDEVKRCADDRYAHRDPAPAQAEMQPVAARDAARRAGRCGDRCRSGSTA